MTNSNLSVSLIVRILGKLYANFTRCTHFLRGVRKLYQNRYLHTCENTPDFSGVFLRGRESGLEIGRKLRVVFSFGYWQKQGSNSEKALKKPDLYAIMLL